MGSRRNSHHPSATAIFDGHGQTSTNPNPEAADSNGQEDKRDVNVEPKLEKVANKGLNPAILISAISENSSECPYYPLGSEASMRPFTPKVGGDEISTNYEPVLVTN